MNAAGDPQSAGAAADDQLPTLEELEMGDRHHFPATQLLLKTEKQNGKGLCHEAPMPV